MKKKKLSDKQLIAKAAQEVLMDELTICRGRLNPKQIAELRELAKVKT